jgi:RNA 2',3'-cyclic 3'-phosphodiesterase
MRLFLGIPLAGPVPRELKQLTERLKSAFGNLRWLEPESWHITLKFLGSVTEEQYGCLMNRLCGLHFGPFPIQLEQPGIFDRAGILYVAVQLGPELVALQRNVEAQACLCGFEAESRPYHPHITLARLKGVDRDRTFNRRMAGFKTEARLSRFRAHEFLLYESHLSSDGSSYEVRHRFPLSPVSNPEAPQDAL